ncbi:hypothetical protein D9M68_867770 [compost metagenome]
MSAASSPSARAAASARATAPRVSGSGASSSAPSTPCAPVFSAMRTRPASSSNTNVSGTARPPAAHSRASTTAVPTFGCPANGTSRHGVKMRTWAVCAALRAGSTKLVSE